MEIKYSDYLVIESCYISAVAEEVNDLMKKGYVPLGGICVTCYENASGGGDLYCQAMAKIRKKEVRL